MFDRFAVPAISYLAACWLMLLMVLTCADVFGRYFLNTPIPGGFELTEMLLAALIFTGLPLVTLNNDHVTVDLLDSITPHKVFRVQHVFSCIVGFACTSFLSYRLWLRASDLGRAGEVTAQLKINTAYLTYMMSTLMGLAAIAALILAFRVPTRHLPASTAT